MKNRFKLLIAACVVFAAIGCSKDQTVTKFNPKGEDSEAAYFAQKSVSQEFATTQTGDQTLLVNIYRQNAQGDLTVGLDQSVPQAAAAFYEIPESVTFRDGEFGTTIPVTVRNVENFAKGATYTATIAVGDNHSFEDVPPTLSHTPQSLSSRDKAATRAAQITKYTTVSISTTLTLEWEPCYVLKDPTKLLSTDLTEEDYVIGPDGKPMLQNGVYTYVFWWTGTDDTVMLERASGSPVFRMTNWGAGVNIIFTIDPSDNSIILTNQSTGDSYSDGTPVMVSDVPSLLGHPFEEYPSTWDGQRTFSFSLVYTLEDGRWFGETCKEQFVLSSGSAVIEEPVPAVGIDYLGLSVSQTGVRSHSLAFTPNDDAAYYYATVLKVDPELAAECAKQTEEYLVKNDIKPGSAAWFANYDGMYAMFFGELSAAFAEELAGTVGVEIEKGTYEGDFPVFRFEQPSEEAWELGAEAGSYTAVAFSYDKTETVKGVDFKVFTYNPEADAAKVQYTLDCEILPNAASALFAYNSIYFGLQAANGDLTSVRYALLTQAEFEAAGLTGDSTPAQLQAYVAANGKSLNEASLKEANNTALVGGYSSYLDAEPATAYQFITCISNADATKTEVKSVTTEAVATPVKLTVAASVTNAAGVFQHTHVQAALSGTEVTGGEYLLVEASDEEFAKRFAVSAEGQVTLAAEVSDEDAMAWIGENGTSFSSGSPTSALGVMNTGGSFKTSLKGAPATRYVVLATARYGNGEASWGAAVQSTDFPPSVAFTQRVEAQGRNIVFNWTGTSAADIFVIKKVVYALVPKSALSAAGVDTSKLSDEQLNDFDARIAAGGSATEIEAQRENAGKLAAILAAEGKTVKDDAAAPINSEGGLNKQFPNMAAGDYALIALANDTYNTKLTVGLVSIP